VPVTTGLQNVLYAAWPIIPAVVDDINCARVAAIDEVFSDGISQVLLTKYGNYDADLFRARGPRVRSRDQCNHLVPPSQQSAGSRRLARAWQHLGKVVFFGNIPVPNREQAKSLSSDDHDC
jgi:hypothetical protein